MIVDLSVRLKQLRLDKRLRQEQVARLVGVSKGAISAYETDIRQPSYMACIIIIWAVSKVKGIYKGRFGR